MRVISGSARGRRLTPPADRRIRPTTDRIKEALFSILHSMCGDFHGFTVLDLCAGTGNLGIEALSRGAGHAVFVDSVAVSTGLVRTNLKATGLEDRAVIMTADAVQVVATLADRGQRFELVFADPPYAKGLADRLLQALDDSSVLADGAVIVVETGADETITFQAARLTQIDRRVYGDTALTFFECL